MILCTANVGGTQQPGPLCTAAQVVHCAMPRVPFTQFLHHHFQQPHPLMSVPFISFPLNWSKDIVKRLQGNFITIQPEQMQKGVHSFIGSTFNDHLLSARQARPTIGVSVSFLQSFFIPFPPCILTPERKQKLFPSKTMLLALGWGGLFPNSVCVSSLTKRSHTKPPTVCLVCRSSGDREIQGN